MSIPAYIYARYSSVEQGKGHSLKRQLENARKHIKQNGWQYPGLEADEPDFTLGSKERDYRDPRTRRGLRARGARAAPGIPRSS